MDGDRGPPRSPSPLSASSPSGWKTASRLSIPSLATSRNAFSANSPSTSPPSASASASASASVSVSVPDSPPLSTIAATVPASTSTTTPIATREGVDNRRSPPARLRHNSLKAAGT